MTMLVALVVQLLRRVRKLLLSTGVLLAGFQVVLILQANSIQTSNSFAKMGDLVPSFARDLMAPSFVAFFRSEASCAWDISILSFWRRWLQSR